MLILFIVLTLTFDILCVAAASPVISLPVRPRPSAITRLNTLSRLNVTGFDNLRELPDPWERRVPGSLITVEFYHYSEPVDKKAFERCYQRAKADIAEEVRAGHVDEPLGEEVIRYTRFTVDLILEPRADMTWYMWAGVPEVIWFYLERNGWKGTKFILHSDLLGDVGRGSLTDSIVIDEA